MNDPNSANSNILAERRSAIINSQTVTGLDYVQFNPTDPTNPLAGGTLNLYFLNTHIPTLSPAEIQLSAVDDFNQVPWLVTDVSVPNNSLITVTLQFIGGISTSIVNLSQNYLITINTNAISTSPYIDPFFNQAEFMPGFNIIARVDCLTAAAPPAVNDSDLNIDYLSKDYTSFRQLLLNRLSLTMPAWIQDNPADIGMVLVEVLAYAADQLSYYQDAAATEAYLNTARRRISVRRHARLLDYQIQEGCNARVWVQVNYSGVDGVSLNPGLQLLTQVDGLPTVIDFNSADYQQALSTQPIIFETLRPVNLYQDHNEMTFYTWGASEFTLSQGVTSAALSGDYAATLYPGDILIFEEVRGSVTGLPEDADHTHRWAVCLTQVTRTRDHLYGENWVTEITWAAADALPFCLAVRCGSTAENISVARGNVVLADHGQSLENQSLNPDKVLPGVKYAPSLNQPNLTFSTPIPSLMTSATQILQQDPRQALPNLQLTANNDYASPTWNPAADLLNSNRFAAQFVAEIENHREVFLRFGDGIYGKQPLPNTVFSADYRIGNGRQGNIGADSLSHWVVNPLQAIPPGINAINNPLPARGGTDPESLVQICMNASQAFRQQNRCVTPQDYVTAALAYPGVAYAAAEFQWTGSWNTLTLAVIRANQQPLDAAFVQALTAYFTNLQLMGYDFEIVDPTYVPLAIALVIQIMPEYSADSVLRALQADFSGSGQNGGFFNLQSLQLGQTLYLSTLVAEAMTVAGVAGVDLTSPNMQFQRYYQPPAPNLPTVIQLSAFEFPQIQNDPNAPALGQIKFIMSGGS